jgi:hypothetical protein
MSDTFYVPELDFKYDPDQFNLEPATPRAIIDSGGVYDHLRAESVRVEREPSREFIDSGPRIRPVAVVDLFSVDQLSVHFDGVSFQSHFFLSIGVEPG